MGMILLEVVRILVAATPLEIAIKTHIAFVHCSVMSRNALWLCVFVSANIAGIHWHAANGVVYLIWREIGLMVSRR